MPRTKGSLNKKKIIKAEAKEKVEKELKAIESEAIREVNNKLTNVLHGTCKECDHEKKMHYGGVKGHCNTTNCSCLEFK